MNDYERLVEALQQTLHNVRSLTSVDPDIEGLIEEAAIALEKAQQLAEDRS